MFDPHGLLGYAAILVTFGIHSANEQGENAIELDLTVVNHVVEVENKIKLRTVASRKPPMQVNGLSFQVLRLGYFDEKRGKMVLYNDDRNRIVFPVYDSFRDMPGSLIGPHGIPFDFDVWGRVGYEHEVTPIRLGVFLVTAFWRVKGKDGYVVSNPVVLMVRPPIDAKGVTKLKLEWLQK